MTNTILNIVIILMLCVITIIVILTTMRLLRESEQRIDRTNDMVCKLAAATSQIAEMHRLVTEEYIKQIDKLQDCRDKVIEQNKDLIRANSILADIASAPKTTINNN